MSATTALAPGPESAAPDVGLPVEVLSDVKSIVRSGHGDVVLVGAGVVVMVIAGVVVSVTRGVVVCVSAHQDPGVDV